METLRVCIHDIIILPTREPVGESSVLTMHPTNQPFPYSKPNAHIHSKPCRELVIFPGQDLLSQPRERGQERSPSKFDNLRV